MSKMQIKFISKGFRDVLFSAGVKEIITQQAEIIKAKAAANAGKGEFQTTTKAGNYGGGRWVSYVQTADYDAAKAEAEMKALSRAVR